ncbi:MAG: glycosyltransferase family 2 protein, partial [Candidatus Neomarinimicrobiota bacterium]
YLSPKRKFNKRPVNTIKPPKKSSIIIPVNNRPEFIVDAIESALKQTIQDIEIIVIVNGGETDLTNQSVERYMKGGDKYYNDRPEVRLITTDINNIGYCLNLGVKNAQSEYYVQLDSDDRLKPDAVEKIIQKFESDPAIGMVIGSYEVWGKLDSNEIIRDKNIPVVTHPEWTEENGRNNLLRINGAGAPRAIPIQIIKDIGYFDMNENPFARNYGEDYDMVLRISEKYKIGRIYDPIYEVIRHSGGTDHAIDQNTINRNDEAKDWMRKEAILRRLVMSK